MLTGSTGGVIRGPNHRVVVGAATTSNLSEDTENYKPNALHALCPLQIACPLLVFVLAHQPVFVASSASSSSTVQSRAPAVRQIVSARCHVTGAPSLPVHWAAFPGPRPASLSPQTAAEPPDQFDVLQSVETNPEQ